VYGRIHDQRAVAEDAAVDRDVCSGPINEYARSKLLFDTVLATRAPAGLRWAGLRYTNVFGPGEQHKGTMASIISQLLRTVAAGGAPTLFADTLTASRDYVPVQWVVQVILRLIEAPVAAGTYNVGSGYPVSFATLLQWCVEFSGAATLPVHLVPNPIPGRYQYWTCADMRKLRSVTGLTPPTADDVRTAALALFQEAAAADAQA
jgi:ADP-L-glycero-D-manno-heptose 6-epimerase